jgi:hypothetical protein
MLSLKLESMPSRTSLLPLGQPSRGEASSCPVPGVVHCNYHRQRFRNGNDCRVSIVVERWPSPFGNSGHEPSLFCVCVVNC